MRPIIVITLFAAAAFAQQGETTKPNSQASVPTASQIKTLTRAEFDKLVAKPGSVFLLDVRNPQEIVDVGGFAGAVNIPVADVEKRLAEIPKDRPVITISNHAARASKAAAALEAHGYRVAGAVGAQSYEADGGKLVKPEKK
jgi:rhodanese-related sulfurtransferase